MTRRTCVFCGDELTRRSKREHVLPEWFTKRWNAGEDGREFCFEINGDLVRRTDGKVHTHSTFPAIKLDVCGQGGRECNGRLNTRFEQPARDPVRALFDRLEPIHGDQTVAMARWTVKTLILWHHPKTEFTHIDHLHRKGWSPRNRWTVPHGAMLEMRDSGRIPKDVSVWLAVIDPEHGPVTLPSGWVLLEPGVRSGMVKLSLPNGWSLLLHVMYHPGRPAENLVADAGLVTRLWPDPRLELDLRVLPRLDLHSGAELPHRFLHTAEEPTK